MKPNFAFFVFTLSIIVQSAAQNDPQQETTAGNGLPYHEIPSYPGTYTPGTVAARMIDALGFRYYWATEGLREKDLKFKPSDKARNSGETLQHIYGLSVVIVNAASQEANVGQPDVKGIGFEELRSKTLQNFKKASDLLKTPAAENLENYGIKYKSGEKTTEYPFWNLINGPVADAIWHAGQIVSFRRSSGNPFNSKVSVFHGKLME